ncbi:hypothetical protein B0H19DRAFT_1260965 [Mycena capillaripes]|nr:hypothetical protein B0H19DRAFT_1260965 [Mycena capillaripes]
MQFTQAFVVFVATALAAVSAVPIEEKKYIIGWEIVENPTSADVPRAIAPRTPSGVKICTDINWGGTCGYAVQPLGVCINLTSPRKNAISSFGPDPGATCFGNDFRNFLCPAVEQNVPFLDCVLAE